MEKNFPLWSFYVNRKAYRNKHNGGIMKSNFVEKKYWKQDKRIRSVEAVVLGIAEGRQCLVINHVVGESLSEV